MFGIGFLEICLIAAVALIFIGPKGLPDTMHKIGRFFVYMQRITSDVRLSVDKVMRDAEAEIMREEIAKRRELDREKTPDQSAPIAASSTLALNSRADEDYFGDSSGLESPSQEHTSHTEAIPNSDKPGA